MQSSWNPRNAMRYYAGVDNNLPSDLRFRPLVLRVPFGGSYITIADKVKTPWGLHRNADNTPTTMYSQGSPYFDTSDTGQYYPYQTPGVSSVPGPYKYHGGKRGGWFDPLW